jgi:hypothetical protein
MDRGTQTVEEEVLQKQIIQIAMNRKFMENLRKIPKSEDSANIGTISFKNFSGIADNVSRHLNYWQITVPTYLNGLSSEQTQKKVQIGSSSAFFFTFESIFIAEHSVAYLCPSCSGNVQMRSQLGEEAYKELWTFTNV